ncbi:MAG: methylmalonyl-CoA mutase family protein [Desulfatibacillaceae bacterium]|nr:methylmalonyl-CoA mutase family protein [Desulfatibacillaceae bacterium]
MKDDKKKDQLCPHEEQYLEKVAKAREQWEEKLINPRLKRFNMEKPNTSFYTPLDRAGSDFLESVGFPGLYPFTAGNSPLEFWKVHARLAAEMGFRPDWGGTRGVGKYGGFGTAGDYRDYLIRMHSMGRKGGPNIAFDLATQCGLDSDSEQAVGEVGRVGVAIDCFEDFATIYEPYTGELEIDKVPSNFTINAPCCVIIAMYAVLAKKRGLSPAVLRGTPQNDILKEFIARGTYIYPPGPSLRLFRDSLVFLREKMPLLNVNSMGGYHIREAGATRDQDLAFSMANAAAYLEAGVEAGLDVNDFAALFTFNAFGGSMEMYHEIAFQRAARRVYARMLKEQFGATNPKAMIIRQPITAHIGCSSTTLQRPLNNWIRAAVGGIAAGMTGAIPGVFPPFDEPLGLGHSIEATQMQFDATRILLYETGITDVLDPWAGSYFMETLTDEIEAGALSEMDKISQMGGTVAAIESGYMQKAVAKSAYEKQKRIESKEDFVVGVNCFTSELELEVSINRGVEPTYDPALMATAEERQIASLKKMKATRDNKAVASYLNTLKNHAKDNAKNLMPDICDCVENNCTLQEICDVMREVFGEFKQAKL